MTVSVSTHQRDRLIASWEQQQNGYVRHRAQRYQVILDALTYARPDLRTVLDIGGGLGSFSKLILDRFPDASVLTLDYDPALLELARHNLRSFGGRSVIIEADLRHPEWPGALEGKTPDAVVSSTALHWLTNPQLVSLYETLASVLNEGAVFFNADHLSRRGRAFFDAVSAADDTCHREASLAAGVSDWEGWWQQLRNEEGFTELVAERDRRFAGATDIDAATLDLHNEGLRAAGFAETGTVWQYFDDYVLYGVR